MYPRRIRLAVAVVVLVATSVIGANGQIPAPRPANTPITPEKRALIAELFTVIHADNMTQSILRVFLAKLPQDVSTLRSAMLAGLTREERIRVAKAFDKDSAAIVKRMNDGFLNKIDFAEITELSIAPIYDKFFTADELRELIAFNKTPTGQKVLQLAPQMMAETMDKAAETLAPRLIEIRGELLLEERARLRKAP